ncbi:hypothetical protein, partial [Nocardia africana]|uniref:hypothetical protein n=1 Tax=Nocardia africana TaxID=134964 RepID=UPI000B16EFA4
MQDRMPELRIEDGRVITAPGVALMWLPVDGEVVAKIPPRKGNRRWLHKSVRIRSPDLDGDRRYLRRSCLTRLVIAAVERYGPWSLGTWRSCRAAPGPVWTRQGWTAVARAWD